jgi:hypothetical protein
MRDRKGNELKVGDKVLVPAVVESATDAFTPFCLVRGEEPECGSPRGRAILLAPREVEKATPLCLAAGALLAACEALIDADDRYMVSGDQYPDAVLHVIGTMIRPAVAKAKGGAS